MKLVLVLLLVLIITGASGAGGIILIHKAQKTSSVVSSTSSNSTPSNWSPSSFSGNNYSFSAMFPCNPKTVQLSGADSNGKYTAYGYVCKYNDGVYEVLCSVYSASSVTLPPLTLSNNASGLNAHIISSKKLTVDGYPAETMEYSASSGGTNLLARYEIVADKNVVYTAVDDWVPPAPYINYFVNNFQVGQ